MDVRLSILYTADDIVLFKALVAAGIDKHGTLAHIITMYESKV